MPVFFFDIFDGHDLPDRQGLDLQDLAAAQVHGAKMASTILSQEPSELWRDNAWAIGVRRESGAELCRIEIKVVMRQQDQ